MFDGIELGIPPPARRRARDVVKAARHRRLTLRRYQRLVRAVIREAPSPELPP